MSQAGKVLAAQLAGALAFVIALYMLVGPWWTLLAVGATTVALTVLFEWKGES